jgi:hypothetical protein
MPKPNKALLGLPVIEDRGVTYLFGQGGYIEVASDFILARITVAKYKLRSPDFEEAFPGTQEVPVTWGGLKGMAEHLKVSDSVEKQRRLSSYFKVFGTHNKPQQKQGAI